MALLVLVSAGLFYSASGSVQGIWGTANSTLVTASARGGTGAGPTGGGGGGDDGHGH